MLIRLRQLHLMKTRRRPFLNHPPIPFDTQATDSLRSNKKNQHQRQQQQQQHVQQQQQDCGRGQQQQYKSWVGTDVALLRACLDERASHRMCPS